MNILGERIIEVLKTDSGLTTLLGSADNILAMNVQERDKRKEKFVVVSTDVGTDGGDVPVQQGLLSVEIAVSRSVANAFGSVATLASAVDDILNKGEVELTDGTWSVINFTRKGSPSSGIQIDDKHNEFFFEIEYEFILDESSSS